MMSERQANFRREYRSRIAGWYNGYAHVALIYTIGLVAMTVYFSNIQNVAWWEWLVIPVVLVICNSFEWFLHMHIMHRPKNVRGLRAIYQRHTLNHHQFFTDQEMRFRDNQDWRVTFFPPYALIVFILMSAVGAVVVNLVLTSNAAWLLMSTTTGMYLIYEFMHFCCHVDENAFVRFCPLVNTIRRHHTAHHNDRLMMEVNMNLTFPIADWYMGTSDIERGLLGHIFNGYNTAHLKTGLKGRPLTPIEASATPIPVET